MSPFDSIGCGEAGTEPGAETGTGTGAASCSACAVRSLALCAVLDAVDIKRLGEIAQSDRYEAGQTIFSEGDPADALFNVVAGAVKLYKLLPDGRRQIIGFLASGDFLGLALAETYAFTAETLTGSTLCRFPRRRLEALLHDVPRLQHQLFVVTATELAAAQDQMLLLGRKTAREKICSFLLALSHRAVQRGHKANPVFLPMSRADIADYLGLTTETVSRTVTQLKTTGVISLQEGNRILIADLDELCDLAEGT
jgi:CRP/FNR family transcriptional regulator